MLHLEYGPHHRRHLHRSQGSQILPRSHRTNRRPRRTNPLAKHVHLGISPSCGGRGTSAIPGAREASARRRSRRSPAAPNGRSNKSLSIFTSYFNVKTEIRNNRRSNSYSIIDQRKISHLPKPQIHRPPFHPHSHHSHG